MHQIDLNLLHVMTDNIGMIPCFSLLKKTKR